MTKKYLFSFITACALFPFLSFAQSHLATDEKLPVVMFDTADDAYSLASQNKRDIATTNTRIAANEKTIQDVRTEALAYTDQEALRLQKQINRNEKEANAGIAAAMAMASIPYVDHHRFSFGIAGAHYSGESALSVGIQIQLNNKMKFRLQGARDERNNLGVAAGFAFGW